MYTLLVILQSLNKISKKKSFQNFNSVNKMHVIYSNLLPPPILAKVMFSVMSMYVCRLSFVCLCSK